MKKAIYLLAMTLGATAMTADAQKNTFLVYGDAGVGTHINASDDRNANFNINLGVGYQFHQNWTVGLTGGYNTFRAKPDGATAWGLNDTYRFGPFIRYTQPINKLFAFYVQGEVAGYGGYTGTTANRTRVTKYTGTEAYVFPGLMMYFCDGWALNLGLGGMKYYSQKERGAVSTSNGFGLTLGDHVNLGVSVNIHTATKGKKFKKHRNSEENQDGYEDWKRRRKNQD